MVTATWEETNVGRALYLHTAGKHISFNLSDLQDPDHVARTGALSFWEGIAGPPPRGRVAGWRWRHGLAKLQRQISKEVKLQTSK